MRTTLSIDDDVLQAARAIADRDRRTVGEVVSELARRGMSRSRRAKAPSGFPVLPRRGVVVTLELVNALREEE
jgi:hypothetical protein